MQVDVRVAQSVFASLYLIVFSCIVKANVQTNRDRGGRREGRAIALWPTPFFKKS